MPKDEPLEGEFNPEIEEAKTLRDLARLEKQHAQLWFLTIFVFLVFILFMLAKDFDPLKFSPREFLAGVGSFQLSALVVPAALLFLAFTGYALFQDRRIRMRRKDVFIQKTRLERAVGNREEMAALLQIISGLAAHKEVASILENIARESLQVLKAHRSTVFLAEEKSGMLKTQFTRASDRQNQQIGLFEEKEVARKTLRQRKPFLLRSPADFSEFFKYEGRDRKITSLISIPLFPPGRGAAVLSAVIINEDRKFSERDLQYFQILASCAGIAMDYARLLEERQKAAEFRKNYEQYLDDILNQLQSLSDIERKRIEDHIGKFLPGLPPEEKIPLAEQSEEVVKGTLPIGEVPGGDEAEEGGSMVLRVDVDGEPLSLAQDQEDESIFIRTPNPLDLGEQFPLRLHLAEGEPPVEVRCKVIWTNKYGKESRHLRRGMGVKFLNLPPELQSRVDNYFRSHKNRQFYFADDPRQSAPAPQPSPPKRGRGEGEGD